MLPSKPSPFTSVSSSLIHWHSQHFLFLEKVIASLALQDLDCIHEVGDLHQRNWTATEARVGSDLGPAGSRETLCFFGPWVLLLTLGMSPSPILWGPFICEPHPDPSGQAVGQGRPAPFDLGLFPSLPAPPAPLTVTPMYCPAQPRSAGLAQTKHKSLTVSSSRLEIQHHFMKESP